MRALMGVHKDRHGTYYARLKVPGGLEEAVAALLGNGKTRQVFLKKSLRTKSIQEANRLAKPVLMGFDRVIVEARALAKQSPVRKTLSDAEIAKIAEYHFAQRLAEDDVHTREGPLFVPYGLHDEPRPKFGLGKAEALGRDIELLAISKIEGEALARGDISVVSEFMDLLLHQFSLNLDTSCEAYHKLGMAVLRKEIEAVNVLIMRATGEPIPTPTLSPPTGVAEHAGGTLSDAFEGWKREKDRPEGTVREYGRALDLFAQLFGSIQIAAIRKSHARQFRESLQRVPRHRSGPLLKASLPELVEWSKSNPSAETISVGTINKNLGAVQTIALWGAKSGVVPDEITWADPFSRMRLDSEESDRDVFELSELVALFASPVFTSQDWPEAAKGPAAFWLPVLAIHTGARRGELAGLSVDNIVHEQGIPFIVLVPNRKRGRRLKNKASERYVPIHSRLVDLGFLQFVETRRKSGAEAWLFPEIAPDQKGAVKAWGKWFHRHLRSVGVEDSRKVFHSFRHLAKDALRQALVTTEMNNALLGQTDATVAGQYGAKMMLNRFGPKVLKAAIESMNLPEVDWSRVSSGLKAKGAKGVKA